VNACSDDGFLQIRRFSPYTPVVTRYSRFLHILRYSPLLKVTNRINDMLLKLALNTHGKSNIIICGHLFILYMIDSDRRPVSNRRPVLKSASTDVNVIISNHGFRIFSNRCPFQTLISTGPLTRYKFAIKNNCNVILFFLICFFLSIFPFFNIINRG
jgi:hypothetical protein